MSNGKYDQNIENVTERGRALIEALESGKEKPFLEATVASSGALIAEGGLRIANELARIADALESTALFKQGTWGVTEEVSPIEALTDAIDGFMTNLERMANPACFVVDGEGEVTEQ